MEYILIFLFSNNKKEENFLKLLEEEENNECEQYNKYLFEFFKSDIISDEIFDTSIKEFKDFKSKNLKENYLIFIFNIFNKLKEQDFEQFESILNIDKNLYNLLNYKNFNGINNLEKNLHKINNLKFDPQKSYNFIITFENKYIQYFKEILKKDHINEKIYFNTNFNTSIKNIIEESKNILYNF